MNMIQLPAGATQQRTEAVLGQVTRYYLNQEKANVNSVFTVAGFSFKGNGQNNGLAFVSLKDWSPWTLGTSVLVSPSPYQGEQDRVMPLPVIGYDNDRFFVQGLSAGAYLWKDQQNQLSLNAYYSPLHFKASGSDSDNDVMKQLNNRHATMMPWVLMALLALSSCNRAQVSPAPH